MLLDLDRMPLDLDFFFELEFYRYGPGLEKKIIEICHYAPDLEFFSTTKILAMPLDLEKNF